MNPLEQSNHVNSDGEPMQKKIQTAATGQKLAQDISMFVNKKNKKRPKTFF